MKALLLEGKSSLELSEVQKPIPEKGQVLVRLKAAALNRRDHWIRQGKYPNIHLNTILGSDGAGIIESIGEGVDPNYIGREVIINPNINWGDDPKVQSQTYHILGMPTNGTFAEYVTVNSDRIHAKPDHLSWPEAASLPLGGLTAYRALFTHGKVKANDTVLISGVGGGVAQFAFLFAKAAAANVYVTSSSDDKIDFCVAQGAKGGFNYRTEGWHKEVFKMTDGFDLVIDSSGGDQINDYIKLMKPAGSIVFYGATNGLPANVDLYKMFWNQVSLIGSTMGNDQEFEEMMAFVVQHNLKPIIDSVRPLADAIEAFDDMKDGKQFGKLVLIT